MKINIDSLSVGDSIPDLVIEPITRSTLALYAGASGDHNPMHIDIDFAKQAGMDDVFAGLYVVILLICFMIFKIQLEDEKIIKKTKKKKT